MADVVDGELQHEENLSNMADVPHPELETLCGTDADPQVTYNPQSSEQSDVILQAEHTDDDTTQLRAEEVDCGTNGELINKEQITGDPVNEDDASHLQELQNIREINSENQVNDVTNATYSEGTAHNPDLQHSVDLPTEEADQSEDDSSENRILKSDVTQGEEESSSSDGFHTKETIPGEMEEMTQELGVSQEISNDSEGLESGEVIDHTDEVPTEETTRRTDELVEESSHDKELSKDSSEFGGGDGSSRAGSQACNDTEASLPPKLCEDAVDGIAEASRKESPMDVDNFGSPAEPRVAVDEAQDEVMDVADIIRDLDQLTDDAGGRMEPEAMETEEGDQPSPADADKDVPQVVPIGEIYSTEDVGTPVQDELRDYDESSEIQLPQARDDEQENEAGEGAFDEVDSHRIELAEDVGEETVAPVESKDIGENKSKQDRDGGIDTVDKLDDNVNDIEKSFTVERAESTDITTAEKITKEGDTPATNEDIPTEAKSSSVEEKSASSGDNGNMTSTAEDNKSSVNKNQDSSKKNDMVDVKTETSSSSQKEINDTEVTGVKNNEGEKSVTAKTPKAPQQCLVCKKVGKCKYNIVRNGDIKHLCDDVCFNVFRTSPSAYLRSEAKAGSGPKAKCAFCKAEVGDPANNKFTTTIGTVLKHFCQLTCKELFIAPVHCSNCTNNVRIDVRDKHCVKTGNRTKNFCCSKCLDVYKKKQKLCTFCHKNVAYDTSALVAPIADGSFRDFCSQTCLKKYEEKADDDDIEIVSTTTKTKNSSVTIPKTAAPTKTRAKSITTRGSVLKSAKCSVCNKMAHAKHEVALSGKTHSLCSDPCFAAFRYANNLSISPCATCGVNTTNNPNVVSSPYEGQVKQFCRQLCLSQFRKKNERIVPCNWCGVQKSNFEMVERAEHNKVVKLFCTLNCLSLFRVNLQATSNQNVQCDQCHKMAPAQYHLTMSDASVRNFCAYACVLTFQTQFQQPKKGAQNTASPRQGRKPSAPTAPPTQQAQSSPGIATRQSKRVAARDKIPGVNDTGIPAIPVISDVVSLAPASSDSATITVPSQQSVQTKSTPTQPAVQGTQTSHVTQQIIIQPPAPKPAKNKSVLCKPISQTKATSCRPHTQTKACQTDAMEPQKAIVPIPVPMYIPAPMAMYTTPVPYPVPIPVPIPIPCFIPTTRKSAASILKHVKEIVERLPADPFEAELLMMAEAVATEGKDVESSSESDADPTENEAPEPYPTPPVTSAPNELGEDVLQMALSIASVMPDEPLMDLETSLHPTPIQPGDPSDHQGNNSVSEYSTIDSSAADILSESPARRGRSRGRRGSRGRGSKKPRIEDDNETHSTAASAPVSNPVTNIPAQPPPDANMVLKYTYGVNAWKHWVIQKNQELQSLPGGSGTRSRTKLYKSDVLQCSADELNFALIKFVKEVRKPNGEEYAPDSIYYLCLGLQQYLYENHRVDNIFADDYYEQFTETLNEVLSQHEVRLNAQGLIVCRIQEEHLWESKQLGAHSPHILLNTLIYFNTKYFMLQTPTEHLSLSFSQIMKHWKKTTHPTTKAQQRHVYLRYYGLNPPTNNEPGQKRKREEAPVYEQGENTDNPLRCPVKLYEFYLSKCPESIKNRNDVFYLVPERSCVPDSPVWYSTQHLGIEAMTKMLNRVRVVREIQEAHLHHNPSFS